MATSPALGKEKINPSRNTTEKESLLRTSPDIMDTSLRKDDTYVTEPGLKPENCNGDREKTTLSKTTSRIQLVLRQLTTHSVLTFTLAAALCLLTQINFIFFFHTQVTSLEREFGFTTYQSGQLLASNEIGFLCFAIPVSHLASRVHVPRVLSTMALVFGVVGMMSGLSHFLFRSIEHHSNLTKSASTIPPALCQHPNDTDLLRNTRCYVAELTSDNATMGKEVTEVMVYNQDAYSVFVYLVAFQVLRGMIGSSRMSMSTMYIERNSPPTDTGFYLGILSTITVLGPAVAFLGGGAISKLHVSLKPTNLTPDHPNWVGAWWLGLIIFGLCASLAPVALIVFGKSVMTYATNPVAICILLSAGLNAFALSGLYMFLPKYIQEQFQVPAWKANFLLGIGELLLGTSGYFLGGWLTRRLKLTTLGLFKLVITLFIAVTLLIVIQMLLGCPQPEIVSATGFEVTMGSNSSDLFRCSCPNEVDPVCGDGVNYFSPCYAGCRADANGEYRNCTYIKSGHATPGLCPSTCVSIYPFVAIFYVVLFTFSVLGPATFLLIIRTVNDLQKGIAIGFTSFLFSIVGFLIGPMVFGGLIDSFCLYWRQPCGVKGPCSIYDLNRFRVQIHTYSLVSLSLCTVCYIAGFLLHKHRLKVSAQNSAVQELKVSVDTALIESPGCRRQSTDSCHGHQAKSHLPILQIIDNADMTEFVTFEVCHEKNIKVEI